VTVNKGGKPNKYSKKTAKKAGVMEKAEIFIEYRQEVKIKEQRGIVEVQRLAAPGRCPRFYF
jgi:hypothetical protein